MVGVGGFAGADDAPKARALLSILAIGEIVGAVSAGSVMPGLGGGVSPDRPSRARPIPATYAANAASTLCASSSVNVFFGPRTLPAARNGIFR